MKKRRLIPLIAFLAILAIAGLIYFNNVFVPIQFKQILANQCAQFFQRKVSIGEIKCHPLKGCSSSDLMVYKKGSESHPFIVIEKIDFNVPIPPIFKTKNFIIPSMNVIKPTVYVVRQEKDRWNLSDIFEKLTTQSKDAKSFPLVLGSISLTNGKFVYTDQTLEKHNTEIIQDLSSKVNLSLKGAVLFTLDAHLSDQNSQITFEGEYHLPSKKFTSRLDSQNINIPRILPLVYNNDTFQLNQGMLKEAALNITFRDNILKIDGNLKTNETASQHGTDGKVNITTSSIETNLSTHNKNFLQFNGLTASDLKLNVDSQTKLQGDLSADDLILTLTDDGYNMTASFQMQNTHIHIAQKREFTGTLASTKTSVTSQNQKINLTGTFDTTEASLTITNDLTFQGTPRISLNYTYDPTLEDPHTYGGNITLLNGTFDGIPYIKKLTKAKGVLNFTPTAMDSESITFLTNETHLELSGRLSDFQQPVVDMKYKAAAIYLEKWVPMFPEYFGKDKMLLSGQVSLEGTYQGDVVNPIETDFRLKSQLSGVQFKDNAKNRIISDINGTITYIPKLLKWTDLKGTIADQRVNINGSLNFTPTKPLVKSKIQSQDINLTTELNLLNSVFQITYLKGKVYDSRIDIRGDVRLPENQAPDYDLRGYVKLDLRNLEIFFPNLKNNLAKIKPEGIVNLETFFKGKVKDWRNWQLVVDANSPGFGLFGYHFGRTTLQLEQRDKYINQLNILSQSYGGQIDIKSSADLSIDETPLIFSGKIDNVSLQKLKNDLPFKEKELSGALSSSLSLTGSLTRLREATGEGDLSIRDGHLWRFNLFKGIWQALLIPEYENIVFTDAAMNLSMDNGRIVAENLQLSSKAVDLRGRGWIDFDNNINFHITPKFKESAILESSSLKKGPTALLSKAESYLTIKVEGTLNKPSYSVNTEPGKAIENATGVILDGVKDILEEIIE